MPPPTIRVGQLRTPWYQPFRANEPARIPALGEAMTASTARSPRDAARWRIRLFKGLALVFALFQLPNTGNLLAPWNSDAAPALSGLASPDTHLWHAALPGAVRLIVTGGVLAALLRKPASDPLLVQWLILSAVFTLGIVVPFAGLPPLLFIVLPTVIVVATYPWPSRLIEVRAAGTHRALAVLTVLGAAVLAPSIWQNIGNQLGDVGGEHASEAHWALDAAHLILLLTAGALSSTCRSGWRTLAVLTGVPFIYLGIAAVAAPEQAGSWGSTGGALGVMAGVAYLLAGVARRRSATTTGSDDEDSPDRGHRVHPGGTGGGGAGPPSPGCSRTAGMRRSSASLPSCCSRCPKGSARLMRRRRC